MKSYVMFIDRRINGKDINFPQTNQQSECNTNQNHKRVFVL